MNYQARLAACTLCEKGFAAFLQILDTTLKGMGGDE